MRDGGESGNTNQRRTNTREIKQRLRGIRNARGNDPAAVGKPVRRLGQRPAFHCRTPQWMHAAPSAPSATVLAYSCRHGQLKWRSPAVTRAVVSSVAHSSTRPDRSSGRRSSAAMGLSVVSDRRPGLQARGLGCPSTSSGGLPAVQRWSGKPSAPATAGRLRSASGRAIVRQRGARHAAQRACCCPAPPGAASVRRRRTARAQLAWHHRRQEQENLSAIRPRRCRAAVGESAYGAHAANGDRSCLTLSTLQLSRSR